MGLLRDGAELAHSEDFRRLAAGAGAYVASQVLSEDPSTPDHEVRDFMARQVALNPEAYARHFAWVCAVDLDIATLGPTVTEAHEAATLTRLENLWTFLSNFYFEGSFTGHEEGKT